MLDPYCVLVPLSTSVPRPVFTKCAETELLMVPASVTAPCVVSIWKVLLKSAVVLKSMPRVRVRL